MDTDYNVGQYFNTKISAETATWQGIFNGLYSTFGGTQHFVSDGSFAESHGGGDSGTGNGNYHLLSTSIGVNMVPSAMAPLPYDLDGQIRNNSGWGSTGAYEQAVGMIQVFAW